MNARSRILSFLREPEAFNRGATDVEVWLGGLERHAGPALERVGAHPLLEGQVAAWRGLADARAGLVLGPPGTGKTHLLAWFILGYVEARHAAGLPTTVFVSAFTRNAIGNLLDAVARLSARFATCAPAISYLGSAPPAGLSDLVLHRPSMDASGCRQVLQSLEGGANVLGGSVWTLAKLMQRRETGGDGFTADLFDLVCIDEASQMVLGHGLMAMAGLKPGGRLVVAGDDRQLPPIRAGREVRVDGLELGGSLYGFMKSAALAEFALSETFRLNGPLSAFPGRLFYEGRYRSAVPDRRLSLREGWEVGLEPWQLAALDPDSPTVVLLHDGPPSATSNPFEAKIVADLCELLARRFPGEVDRDGYVRDVWSERLAVVSPHRAQNAVVRRMLPAPLRGEAFVETIDRVQGKEKDAVVLSYCVADAEFALAEADFIFSPERLNVAVTRARSKLVVIVSRRLLDAVPGDQDQMDKAETLREFVFGTTFVSNVVLDDADGRRYPVQLRVSGFGGPAATAVEAPLEPAVAVGLDDDLRQVEDAVRALSLSSQYGNANEWDLDQALAGRPGIIADLVRLQVLGRVRLNRQRGPKASFWTAQIVDPAERVFAVDAETVAGRLEGVIRQVRRGAAAPEYVSVRHRFAWVGPDGEDVLKPIVDGLQTEGLVSYSTANGRLTIEWVDREEETGPATASTADPPTEADFQVLNALEDIEAARINFGVFEAWSMIAGVADRTGMSRDRVSAAVGRLLADGWLMSAAEGRIRSRMAELVREVRYVKQRFDKDDAANRPYLVRSIKVVLRNRDKPGQVDPVHAVFERLAAGAEAHHAAALRGLAGALTDLWTSEARLAAFQTRSLERLTRAWDGEGGDTFVVAADTGSGKTEAACLPLIAAAAGDRLAGVGGVRAILAYPRIRLATNQAQRLARYLAALARRPDMPTVTLGLQIGTVPNNLDALDERDVSAGWADLGDGRFQFPFFDCPACGGGLLLKAGAGVGGADLLTCTACEWSYGGWIGSKRKIRAMPPSLFVPTTDSLHQWMHDDRYGRLFGDDPAFAAPRAFVADEIHLYSHVHGAQVGATLRRLVARAESNARGRGMIAIGMSATLGDPRAAWARLVGRECAPALTPEASEKAPRPRGREYFFFVQPETESRGKGVAGASTTIQALMCLSHGMRRRTGKAGGFRSLVFLDSIDKVRRVHAAHHDAEMTKRLARFRTAEYPDDPATGVPPTACCREPHGCDAFRDGECWYFAATDDGQRTATGRKPARSPLTVADRPVSSETTGRVEALIKGSDVVFATSSLEVGYDDPDITMVYQHYAPANLASFIQRKGRGGRDGDDRPLTGVTLSMYSSRDAWWFSRPEDMVNPSDFETPLNPDNHFVRRGQILATVLDAFARSRHRRGQSVDVRRPSDAAMADAVALVERVFGEAPWTEFGHSRLADLWGEALGRLRDPEVRYLREVREGVDWIPNALFDAVNLPRLRVVTSTSTRVEDISIALRSATPGNATRRYGAVEVCWRPPVNGSAPWFAAEDYGDPSQDQPRPFGDDPEEWLSRLPDVARPALSDLSPGYFRPTTLTFETLGRAFGVGWQSDWIVPAPATPVASRRAGADSPQLRVAHESTGRLRGFPVVKADEGRAERVGATSPSPVVGRFVRYLSGVGGQASGLALANVFWGADADVRLKGPAVTEAAFTQTFCRPGDRRPLLHGYHVHTEGIQVTLDAGRLDAFVAREMEALDRDEPRRKWHAGQMLRFLVESGAAATGVNAFEASRAAELMVSAAASDDLRRRLSHLVRFWGAERLLQVLEGARSLHLAHHPMLSRDRVARVAESLGDPSKQALFRSAVEAVGDRERFAQYLRSTVVHALAVRLKESFLQIGRGDERQVVMHVRLPIQFARPGEATITICEAGAHGDGTTRAFLGRLDAFEAHWRDGFMTDCQIARDDAVLDDLFARTHDHPTWRALNPNDPTSLALVAGQLGLRTGEALPASALRVLFGREKVAGADFELFDVASELRTIDREVFDAFGRPPSPWELASAAVERASERPESVTGRLLLAYRRIEDAADEDSLSPEARFADQVFRLHSRKCVDGCRGCMHQSGEMMPDSMVEASTSRTLLARFLGDVA